jgi:hypothetical protein
MVLPEGAFFFLAMAGDYIVLPVARKADLSACFLAIRPNLRAF